MNRFDVMVLLGVLIVAIGAGLIYVPAGVIVLGLGLAVLGVVGSAATARGNINIDAGDAGDKKREIRGGKP